MEKYVFISLGILFTLWFLAPFFTKRIINAGNGTGLVLSVSILLLGLFYPQITAAIHTALENKHTRPWLYIGAGILLLLFITALIFSVLILSGLFQKPREDATLVVLGCKVYGTRPSLMLEERLQAAYHYMEEHPGSMCVVSGGKGDDEDISEAACMYQALVTMGIAENRLYLESASTTTRENLAFSLEIIKRQGLSENLAIVSNEFHIYRSIRLAKKLGLNAGGIPAKTAWWLFPTYYVRELLCILNERIRLI